MSPYEHPMELPQFKHSQEDPDVKTHESPRKQAQNGSNGASHVVTDGDGLCRSATLENKGGTLWDDSRRLLPIQPLPGADPLEGALARALDLATSAGRLDLVDRILAQVERRRG